MIKNLSDRHLQLQNLPMCMIRTEVCRNCKYSHNDNNNNTIFAIVQSTVSDLLKDSNPLGLYIALYKRSKLLVRLPHQFDRKKMAMGLSSFELESA